MCTCPRLQRALNKPALPFCLNLMWTERKMVVAFKLRQHTEMEESLGGGEGEMSSILRDKLPVLPSAARPWSSGRDGPHTRKEPVTRRPWFACARVPGQARAAFASALRRLWLRLETGPTGVSLSSLNTWIWPQPFPTASQNLYFSPALPMETCSVILPGINLTCHDFKSTSDMQSAFIQA